MGTRGAFGFTIDGTDKVSYNQYDSYYSGRGLDTVRSLRQILKTQGEAWLQERVRSLKVVSEEQKPTRADIAALAPYTDLGVSTGKTDDWYCLTRKAHGDIAGILEMGYILDAKSFLSDSLFCEYAYIINCDTRMLELYRGFQDKPHKRGRFAHLVEWVTTAEKARGQTQYYPVALVTQYSFNKLPSNLALIDFVEDVRRFHENNPKPCKTCGQKIKYNQGKYFDLKGDHAHHCTHPSL